MKHLGIINVLDKQTANLIAAGEVVERPSSAIKEMLENCADAGATSVTVEIKNGGTSFIRVTDNGCGMVRDDVPKCILRHATSKIRTGADLEGIGTFGFRGEALAAIASVSKVRIMTKSDKEDVGTLYEVRFGEEILTTDAGCPQGTTITVENIFENVPARRKFLKKDSTEALSVMTVCEKFALSRPDIALTYISDNNVKIQTPGDSDLASAIYACMGRDFASVLFPVDYEYGGLRIHGYIAKPEFSRPNRNMQNFFVNSRYIRSRTMMAALEEGFRGFCPTGKFPACVLFCDIDLRLVDVNVHPAKLEIKFSDERRVFDSVYFAVKNALSRAVTFAGFSNEQDGVFPNVEKNNEESVQVNTEEVPKSEPYIAPNVPPLYASDTGGKSGNNTDENSDVKKIDTEKTDANNSNTDNNILNKEKVHPLNFLSEEYPKMTTPEIKVTTFDEVASEVIQSTKDITEKPKPSVIEVQKQEELITSKALQKPIYIGEVFDTYIIVQNRGSLYIIDKHAAHERIIYEKLKRPEHENSAQYLLEPINVNLTSKEAEAAIDNKDYFASIGFDFDLFGDSCVIVRSIPTPIALSDCSDVFTFLAGKLSEGNKRSAGEIFDRALFTAACRAAIKGGDKNTDLDNKYIVDEIFNNEAVLYCPHGRPVIAEFTKEKLGKMFDRN